jgi:hypothetical protein
MKKVTFAVLALALLGCGRDYPQKTRDEYMGNCMAQGASHAYCKCTLERLEDTYDHGEFLRLEQEILRGRSVPDEMEEAVLTCRAEN